MRECPGDKKKYIENTKKRWSDKEDRVRKSNIYITGVLSGPERKERNSNI